MGLDKEDAECYISEHAPCKTKKNGKKLKTHWKNRIFAIILMEFLVAGALCSGAGNETPRPGGDSGVRVELRTDDAEKFSRIDRLQRELAGRDAELAALRAENAALKSAGNASRRELLELLTKYQRENGSFRSLQLVLADALSNGKVQGASHREDQLNSALRKTIEHGGALALSSSRLSELADESLKSSTLPPEKRSELALAADRVRKDVRGFLSTSGVMRIDRKLDKCRILAVDHDLAMVVLPVGQVHGAFNGLLFRAGKKPTTLKVVSVRPFVAAAVVVSGDIAELSPGTEAAAARTERQGK